ncbi:MAG: GNAT family N-acetyltransferase [Hyphomicrobiales bacterium]
MTYSIRTAALADAEAVTALLEACYPTLFAAGYEPAILAAALPRMTKSNPRLLASGHFFVAESETGAIVGCGGWSKEQPGGTDLHKSEGHIRHFATHPDWLRRGIARAIIEHSIDQARAAGIHRLECYSSLVAIRFYEAVGFAVVGPWTVELGPGVTLPGCLMRREIA